MHVFHSTRLKRRGDSFDKRLDSIAVPVLTSRGFQEVEPYCYRRQASVGEDVVYFNITPKFFLVHVTYRPAYIFEIDELYDYFPGEPQFGHGHLLTPKGPFVDTSWGFKTRKAAERDRSIESSARALEEHAVPWFEEMRNPPDYAESISPTTIMYLARSREVIGETVAAEAAYEEQFRSEICVFEICRSVEEFAKVESSRVFVYLCIKLGKAPEECRLVQKTIGYYPTVSLLISKEIGGPTQYHRVP